MYLDFFWLYKFKTYFHKFAFKHSEICSIVILSLADDEDESGEITETGKPGLVHSFNTLTSFPDAISFSHKYFGINAIPPSAKAAFNKLLI